MKDKFGLVGSPFPELNLPNSREESTNVRDLLGKKNVVVVRLRGLH